jgi:hypothetical protein
MQDNPAFDLRFKIPGLKVSGWALSTGNGENVNKEDLDRLLAEMHAATCGNEVINFTHDGLTAECKLQRERPCEYGTMPPFA